MMGSKKSGAKKSIKANVDVEYLDPHNTLSNMPSPSNCKTIVGILYVETFMTTCISASSDTLVDEDLEKRCLDQFLSKWHEKFPGIPSTQFVARPEPPAPPGLTIAKWAHGIVTIGLGEDFEGNGLLGQISALSGNLEHTKDLNMNLINQLRECKATKSQSHVEKSDVSDQDIYKLEESHNMEIQERESKIDVYRNNTQDMLSEANVLRNLLKKEEELSNKVRRRVALSEARRRIEKELGRPKEKDDTWSHYFQTVTSEDWKTLELQDEKVQKLLQDGAFPLNQSLHEIPPEEISASIYRADLLDKDAWTTIFKFGYPDWDEDAYFTERCDETKLPPR